MPLSRTWPKTHVREYRLRAPNSGISLIELAQELEHCRIGFVDLFEIGNVAKNRIKDKHFGSGNSHDNRDDLRRLRIELVSIYANYQRLGLHLVQIGSDIEAHHG